MMDEGGRNGKRDRWAGGDGEYDGRKRRSGGEEFDLPVSTLHITNLPVDCSERELRLLASFLPGLEGAVMTGGKGDRSPIGFIKFASQVHAIAGAHALNGFLFDEADAKSILRVSLAKRDMNIRGSERGLAQPAAAQQYGGQYGGFPFQGLGQFGAFADAGGAMNGGGMMAAHPQDEYERHGGGGGGGGYGRGNGGYAEQRHVSAAPAQPAQYTISTRTTSTAIDTMCVKGLPRETSQTDLEEIFAGLEGFREMKILNTKGLAFVAFHETTQAQTAMSALEGKMATLPGSTGRDTVMVEFARRSLETRGGD